MADNTNPPPSGVQLLQHRDRSPQTRAVERTEPFVNEQALDPEALASGHLGKAKGEGKADQEALST